MSYLVYLQICRRKNLLIETETETAFFVIHNTTI